MPHQRINTFGVVFVLVAVLAAPLWAVEPTETLLPDTTKGFVSVTNVKDLVDHWNETQIGKLMQDPVMEPFRKDLQRQFEQRWTKVKEKLGITIDDLRGVPSGEVAIALLQPGPDQSAIVMLADVTDNQEKAKELLGKATASLLEQGSTKQTEKVGGQDVDVFTIPKENPDDEEEPQRHAALLLHGDWFIVSDSTEAMAAVLELAGGAKSKRLADVAAFKTVMARCAKDAGEDNVPQVRWFVEPFGYAEAARVNIPQRDRRPGKPLTEILKNAGFGALDGMGGFVSVGVEGYEFIHRTAVSAPPPYEKSMKILDFPNKAECKPQPWIPRDVATYSTAYIGIANAFQNLGPLVDEYIGEPGAWQDILLGLKEDKHGPQVDLEIELIDQLGNQVTIITDFNMPITTTSERILIAIDVKDNEANAEAAVAKALEKLLDPDDNVQRRELPGREELMIWEKVPPKEKAIDFSLNAIPTFPGEDPLAQPAAEEEEEGPGLFPNAAVTVCNGHLFIASHLDYLVEILKEREERDTLASAVDFQVIGKRVEELGKERCAWVFSRTDKEYRATYELIRQGKMPESETMLGRMLNTIFTTGKKGVPRQQEVDGSKLPEFDVIRRHLGKAGGFGVTEEKGWFFKGFMLP